MTQKLPTPAEQQAEYQRRKAEYDAARARGETPPHPVKPHTPGPASAPVDLHRTPGRLYFD